jgi:hypothetical protein
VLAFRICPTPSVLEIREAASNHQLYDLPVASGNDKQRYSRIGAGLILAALVLGIATVYVGTQKQPNALAAALLQAITFVFSIIGAYFFATASAQVAAEDMIRPHARSAFRRVRNIYAGLGRILREVDNQIDIQDDDKARLSLQIVRSMVIEQASTADDALEDWRDLVPDEVRMIEDEARARAQGEGGGS